MGEGGGELLGDIYFRVTQKCKFSILWESYKLQVDCGFWTQI
jgi:hypothetical protein